MKKMVHYSGLILLCLFNRNLQAQIFEEKAMESGIVHHMYDPNAMGGGVAIFDFNNDGFEDIYFTGGLNDDKLYENLGDGTFVDVTKKMRITAFNIVKTMGVVAGDIDNDGFTDLFVTTAEGHPCYLLKNEAGKSFKNISRAAGIDHEAWNMTATMADYDLDGDLDIYVGNYVEFSDIPFEQNITNAEEDFFYRNNGNSTFEKLENPLSYDKRGCTLVASFSDYDQDGDSDLFVLNDFGDFYQSNKLLRNNFPDNKFEEITDSSGMNAEINSMGIAVGDFNEDGNFDYYVTNIGDNLLYEGLGNSQFRISSDTQQVNDGKGASWGTTFMDVDNDSYLDLFMSKGSLLAVDDPQENKLYRRNSEKNTFDDVSQVQKIDDPNKARGMAQGDFNNDGKLDFVVCNMRAEPSNKGEALLYINEGDDINNWVKVALEGTLNNREGYGALVRVFVGDRQLIREISGGGTYLSHNSSMAHFGLGGNNKIDSLTVDWPGGGKSRYYNLDAKRSYKVQEETELFTVESAILVLNEGESVVLQGEPRSTPGIFHDTIQSDNNEYRKIRTTRLDFKNKDQGGGEGTSNKEQSVARKWNDLLLESIRNDYARPTVHARNLFHTSVAMYDAWAAYNTEAETFFLGKTLGNYNCAFTAIPMAEDIVSAQQEAISYASHRLLSHRFENSPGATKLLQGYNELMTDLGYDPNDTSVDYTNGSPAALGNYIAEQLIAFGLQDGSNEINDYANTFYEPKNEPLIVDEPGDATIQYPNNWQPLALGNFIDQSGNVTGAATPDFLGAEWGKVVPFTLDKNKLSKYNKEGNEYWVYQDPGVPYMIKTDGTLGLDDPYKWSFALVSVWSSHLDSSYGEMIDISPASIGNLSISEFPETFEEYKSFYNIIEGADPGKGHDLNPATGSPYKPQMVDKGDYTRVLAEFWADGPDSETPPGHWFTILNYVSDHPLLEKKFNGKGVVLSNLEWDVKTYLTLGGAMHDAAVTAWGIKGYYDYVRPISAIRYMASKGQSSDADQPTFDPEGIPLIPGYIEIVQNGEVLAGESNENAGKIKLYAWKGSHFIENPGTDVAGVGWILADDWVPYQRPSFVTPPFAGYISGHSTFSRAGAEVLTDLTGNNFFPGGMGVFDAEKNEFLIFEEGPSTDLELQWATYQDASDQCSLSRIWGGIHPPIDDIRGRRIGETIGKEAFEFSENFFYKDADQDGYYSYEDSDDNDSGIHEGIQKKGPLDYKLFPVPVKDVITVNLDFEGVLSAQLYNVYGAMVLKREVYIQNNTATLSIEQLPQGMYIIVFSKGNNEKLISTKILKQ